MGFSTAGMHRPAMTGFRSNSNRSHTTPAQDWANYPDALRAVVERLRGVVIENRPAIEILRQHDSSEALHYIDPPYPHETRSQDDAYDHEMSSDDHLDLLTEIKRLEGAVCLSGYPNLLYDGHLDGWDRVKCHALADGARPRCEVLWLNQRASARSPQKALL
jgi:DNA adenine methylase